MSKYLTYEQLAKKENAYELCHRINEACRQSVYGKKITVFLSHRHSEDKNLIMQVRGFFASMGAGVYIDWQDQSMPAVTNKETAVKLKERINTSNKFVVLATPQSIESIWIPWEIGLADQMRGLANIAILPVVHTDSTWERREYYRLYSRIAWIDGVWRVLEPQNEYLGIDLVNWLQK